MSELYLRIALPSPLRRLFDYRAPTQVSASAWQPGVRVRVPFGRRELVGILVETASTTNVPANKLKDALAVLDQQRGTGDKMARRRSRWTVPPSCIIIITHEGDMRCATGRWPSSRWRWR